MLYLLVSYSRRIRNLPHKIFYPNVCYPKEHISFVYFLAATIMNADSGRTAKCKLKSSPETTPNTDGKNFDSYDMILIKEFLDMNAFLL